MPASGRRAPSPPSADSPRGVDADHDAGVGVALVARVLAHAVGDDAARLGGRRDHRAAGAHAEAVDRAAVAARGARACSRRRRAAGGRRSAPKRARSISDCGCSMRKPIENGLASMNTPRSCSIAKVSRALWPSASTTWSARSSLLAAGQRHAAHAAHAGRLRSAGRSTRCSKRISPPSALDLGAHLLDHARPAGTCRCAACAT